MAPLLRFYGLTLAISWIAWMPLVLSRTGLGWLPIIVPMPWVVAGTLGPMLAGLIVHRVDTGNWRAFRPFAPWRRLALGTMAGMATVAAVFVIGAATVLSQTPFKGWDWSAFGLFVAKPLVTLVGGPLFEEWGWRGYAQARLQRQIGPLRAALLIGPFWALWHLPLFLVPTWSSASLPSYIVMVTALSVVMAWGFNLAGGAVVAAILMHATYNASSRVLGGFLGNAAIREWPDGVGAILASFVVAAAVIAVATRGRLGFGDSADRAVPVTS